MKKVAIITGASSGIGKCFAKTLNEFGVYDEVWLIARREERLISLAEELPYTARAIALDLSKEESLNEYRVLLNEDIEVGLLINCSGFGKFTAVVDSSVEENTNMVDLNCKALLALCQITIPYMTKGSKIINIASVAAFQPIPYIGVYGATKAFVLSFSRALNRELKSRGISVTAVCPFWTKTEFFDRAVEEKKVVKKYIAMYKPEQIVRRAYRDAKRGKDVSKFGFIARCQVLLVKLLPHKIIMDIWMKQQDLD
ncbi:MAG: SDR family NAD(P)-dependent oxidoreductase [Clostridia bacterium]|nr:SDR family NAD(P)-dependent oxidoreductase [Clostridia bacterium]